MISIDFARMYSEAHPELGASDVRILLTEEEMLTVNHIGQMRYERSIQVGANESHGLKASHEKSKSLNFDGARAEFAVAKFLGLTLEDTHYYEDNDAFGYGVRSTKHGRGHLIIYDSDPDPCPFVLVLDKNSEQILRGWMFGFEGKGKLSRSPYGRGGSWNKQEELHPMRTLPDIIGPF